MILRSDVTLHRRRAARWCAGERRTAARVSSGAAENVVGIESRWDIPYDLRAASRLPRAIGDGGAPSRLGEAIRLPDGDAHARTIALYRIRNALRGGALVYITADGPFGAEAFRIELAGGPLVHSSRLACSAATAAGVPTFPVLTWYEHGRRTIEVHPALPVADPDPSLDARQCHAALAPLISEYVMRFPDQCRWVAMPRWSA